MEQLNLWEEIGENFPSLKLHESNDWKWSLKDYPEQKKHKGLLVLCLWRWLNYGV